MKKKIAMVRIILLAAFAVQADSQPPVITSMTCPTTVTGKTASCKATATDNGGETNLTYTWSVAGDQNLVTFSPNGTNAAKNTTATYKIAGWYITTVTVKDKGVPISTDSETRTIWVQQTPTALNVWPTSITTSPAVPRKFTATVRDQFNKRLATQPVVTWSISGNGWMQQDGTVFTNTSSGTWTVTAKYTTDGGATIQNTGTISVAIPNLTTARTNLKNIFFIMQENRSFDNYFGTYQGANGFARIDIDATKLHHHTTGKEIEYPHIRSDAKEEVHPNNYDPSNTFLLPNAFTARAKLAGATDTSDCYGYHNGAADDLCNYWQMADTFVLQDNMFESCKSYSKPSHCYLVSGWSANTSGQTDVGDPNAPLEAAGNKFLWTSIASFLKGSRDWTYFRGDNFTSTACCTNLDGSCFKGNDLVHDYWLPMSKFKDSKPDSQLTILLNNLKNNPSTVPKVSWIVPGRLVSEHPGQAVDVRVGQAYVTTIVKAIMSSSIWNNCAIFISWDDWGGHYDHVIPPYSNPSNDNEGWGIRVPGIMLSPFAKKASSVAGQKRGWVDHEQYSHDAYLKLIEDLFCGSQRISGDGRTIIRENMVELGNLLNEFDFTVTDRKNTQAFRTKLVCKNY